MLTEDYLIRAINQLLAVIARALGLKTAGMYIETLRLIDESYDHLLNVKAEVVRSLEDHDLLLLINPGEQMDTARLATVAELSQMEGDVFEDLHNESEMTRCYQRAVYFFLECEMAGMPSGVEPVKEPLESLVDKLGFTRIPDETLFTLFQYYQNNQKDQLAEQVLVELVIRSGYPPDLTNELENFYRKLLSKSDTDLESAGFERKTVTNKLNNLELR
jgi:hypothetical protein